MTAPTPRQRLVLPAQAGANNGTATTTPGKKPAASAPPKQDIREFTFPDGRLISIYRHGIWFATPWTEDAECTLAGVKGGKSPTPLKIPYEEFLGWWRGKDGVK